MGVVYGGVHRPLGRPVAIKRLPGALAEDQRMSSRFEHEARLLARLDHPHIVPVYDYVRDRGEHLLVMERLDGGTVWSRFASEGLTAQQSCGIVLAALSGLHAAHEQGVLHLDVKPKNLLFTSGGVVKVADFGIAQVVSEGATLVTHAGAVLGTPAYIAPEQALGNALTPGADVYASGTVLYELLTGDLPFERGGGPLAMIQRRVYQEPRPITGVPSALAEVVMRSLVRDPSGRYRNAETFAMDLAGAAALVFGPDWLMKLAMPVHLTPQVAASSTHPAMRPSQPRDTMSITHARVRATMIDPALNPTPPVAHLSDTLMPAASVIKPGGSSVWFTLAAVLAAIVLVVLPFVVSGRTLPLLPHDLATPVTNAGAQLKVTVAGVTFADVTRTEPVGFVLPGAARWIIGGAATATIDGTDYLLLPDQTPLLSIMGAGSIVLLLFTIAYLESNLRALRRRQAGAGVVVLCGPLGFGFGLAVWLVVSVFLRHEPTSGLALVCGVLGAVTGVCAAVATRRSGLRAF
ncbi:serine/threonine protein kinase [Lentzea tibetensis]|uniref:non-specific serine/threonine protein kinase n=2 Tax=Lentzea tibetensis TaxID=2591470 RepID=A0A563EWH2_9PSEU|nr:serine/threonine protein kinase [Lentzea tibetensis]